MTTGSVLAAKKENERDVKVIFYMKKYNVNVHKEYILFFIKTNKIPMSIKVINAVEA